MKRVLVVLVACLGLFGCDRVNVDFLKRDRPEGTTLPDGVVRPMPRPEGLGEEVSVDRPVAPSGPLGGTVVSLGTATEPGLWLKTPLVAKTRPGRVIWAGKTLALTLVPIEGESGAGSRISLQAMQALGMPLTELTEVQVYAD